MEEMGKWKHGIKDFKDNKINKETIPESDGI